MKKLRLSIILLIALVALTAAVSAAEQAQISFTHSPQNSYWNVDVLTSGSALLPKMNDYPGWCAGYGVTISDGTYWFNVYSSLDALSGDPNKWPAGFVHTMYWDKVNYIINHKGTANWQTVQAACWAALGFAGTNPYTSGSYPFSSGSIGGFVPADYQALMAAADANAGYIPYCGEKYAILILKEGYQPIFVEVDIPQGYCRPPPPVPEFPSLALPAGMMIGMVGLVYYVRGREN